MAKSKSSLPTLNPVTRVDSAASKITSPLAEITKVRIRQDDSSNRNFPLSLESRRGLQKRAHRAHISPVAAYPSVETIRKPFTGLGNAPYPKAARPEPASLFRLA